MAKKRRKSSAEGEGLALSLVVIGYAVYQKIFEYPLLVSLGIGLILALFVLAVLLIARSRRVRKANLLARASLYRDYSPIEFEHLTAEIFRQMGYTAQVTAASGDGGLDVILGKAGTQIGVQCKKHQHSIGPGLIREFIGALEGAGLNQGYFVTTSDYTQAAQDTAQHSQRKITLISGEQLGELRNRAEKRINTDLIPADWWQQMSRLQKGIVVGLYFVLGTLVLGTVTYLAVMTWIVV